MTEQQLAALIVAAVTGHDELALAALADHLEERGLADQAQQLREHRGRGCPRQVRRRVTPGDPSGLSYVNHPYLVTVDVAGIIKLVIGLADRNLNHLTRRFFGTVTARRLKVGEVKL